MECVMGIRGNGFVLLATDTNAARSIVAMKTDYEKSIALSNNLVMSCVGDSGDVMNFSEFIHKNIKLYNIRNGYELSPKAAANFTRRNLAEALRSRNAYQVSMLLGGCSEYDGAVLYFMDHLSALVEVPFAAHGYGSFFSLSIMDNHYKPDLSKEDAMNLLQKCIDEIARRFIVNMPVFKVKLVESSGITVMKDIHAANHHRQ